jgi:hypothetical protein
MSTLTPPDGEHFLTTEAGERIENAALHLRYQALWAAHEAAHPYEFRQDLWNHFAELCPEHARQALERYHRRSPIPATPLRGRA